MMKDVRPNCFTFPMVLKSCGKLLALVEGQEVHCVVLKVGFLSIVDSTLIDVYSIAGRVKCALGYVVLWNRMITGYIECGDMEEARKLFDVMPNKDVMSWNTLLNGYANNGDMKERNIFSWNGLIGGYAHNGRFTEVIDTFKRMLNESDVKPNDATIVNVLSACTILGALDLGKWVHVYAESNGYKHNVYVTNGLIDMYAKCGVVGNAVDVAWSGSDVSSLFAEMKNSRVKPDVITFIGVLCACSHMGLVEDGFACFNTMKNEYSIPPRIEHYGCMVDLLGRAGHLEQAMNFVEKMPVRADAVIWTALLGACRLLVLQKLIELDPKNPANYVMLANICGDTRRWKDVAELKVVMRDTGSRKFYCFDERHSKSKEIYGALRSLMKALRSSSQESPLFLMD
ncbi:unnamed protein product [Withania somnifera]